MKKPLADKESISFIELLRIFSGGWKFLVLGVILGGAAGLAISALSQPIYEAVAVYTFSIDFARTGLLTDIEEDQVMEVAGDILKSSAVLENTIRTAGENGIQLSSTETGSVLLAERRFNQWLLKIHWKEPSVAAKLSNIWAEAARSALKNSEIAALKADSLQRHILSLETCLQNSTSGLPAQPLCQVSNHKDLLAEIQNSGQDLQEWRSQANGYFPGLNYTWSQEAQIPSAPIQHSRGGFTLAGGLAGLFAAAMLSLLVERKPS
ncbi:MAG: hypothetical protein WCG34_05375 [Leptolinea sp.]